MSRILRPDYAQSFLLPPSLEDWVPADHPVRFVRDFVDALDLSELGIPEPKAGVGRPPYGPDVLLKVWLFGYMSRIRSTRGLEKACLEVMPFLWLTGNLHPDHNTLWRFFDQHRVALPKLFKRVVQVAAKEELIGFVLHALDGTKLTAASSTDEALHRKGLEEKLKHLDAFIAAYMKEVTTRAEDDKGKGYAMPSAMTDEAARQARIRTHLERRIEDRADAQLRAPAAKTEEQKPSAGATVEGEPVAKASSEETSTPLDAPPGVAAKATERSVEPVQQEAEVLKEEPSAGAAVEGEPVAKASAEETSAPPNAPPGAAAKAPEPPVDPVQQEAELLKEELEKKLAALDEAGVNHLHEAEPEARMMKGRGWQGLGYNAQIVVDHDSDMIVACDVVAQQNDLAQLVPMTEQVRATLGRVADATVGDAGYANGEQLRTCEESQTPVIVALREDAEAKGALSKAHFRFNAESNVYVCPKGETLLQVGTGKWSATMEHPDALYRCRNKACPVLAQCTKDPLGRKIRRSHGEGARERQVEKQQDPRVRILLSLRKEIVEHLFGIVKTVDGFRRFTVRGLEKANAQWALVCTAVNLRKLLAWWREGKLTFDSLKTPSPAPSSAATTT